MENVAILTERGLDVVLGDLAASGYSCEWFVLSAGAVGAPHRRDRIFIIAYADDGQREQPLEAVRTGRDAVELVRSDVSDADRERRDDGGDFREGGRVLSDAIGSAAEGDAHGRGRVHRLGALRQALPEHAGRDRQGRLDEFRRTVGHQQWGFECGMDRVVDGVPFGMDDAQYQGLVASLGAEEAVKIATWAWQERIKSLGNAVVPLVAEFVARELLLKIDEDARDRP